MNTDLTAKKSTLSLIVAMDQNRLIGKNNDLPWRLPADLRHFKSKTMGHPVLMGRKTYESIGKPLPGRTNIVMTRDEAWTAEGCIVVHSIEQAIAYVENDCSEREIMVMGGAEIYNQALPQADKLYITKIDDSFEGDTHFPPITEEDWRLVYEMKGTVDERNIYPHRFQEYERTRASLKRR